MEKEPLVVKVTALHKALLDFTGQWNVIQKLYPPSASEPMIRKGKTTYESIAGGLGALMNTVLHDEEGKVVFNSIGIHTWNVITGNYETCYLDTYSYSGFSYLLGSPIKELPFPPSYSKMKGKVELAKGYPEVQRVWTGACDFPLFDSAQLAAKIQSGGNSKTPCRLVEHQVSENEWVLTCSVQAEDGTQHLSFENTYTRM